MFIEPEMSFFLMAEGTAPSLSPSRELRSPPGMDLLEKTHRRVLLTTGSGLPERVALEGWS